MLASLKPGHLPVIRPWFSQISASLQAVSCNCASYCVDSASAAVIAIYILRLFSAYTLYVGNQHRLNLSSGNEVSLYVHRFIHVRLIRVLLKINQSINNKSAIFDSRFSHY